MKNPFVIILLSLLLTACSAGFEVLKTDKCQLRRTLKEDVFQFNFDLVIQFDKAGYTIDISELEVNVNDVYLGKAVIAAETLPVETERYILPVRVTYPSSALVITDENKIKVEGFLNLNQKKYPVHFEQDKVYINNMTVL